MKMTPLVKAVSALHFYRSVDGASGVWGSADFRKGLAVEIKSLRDKTLILYAVTALIAFVLIGGGVPEDATVEIIGTTVPVSKISLQALSLINSSLFGAYMTAWISFLIAHITLEVISRREGVKHWHFYVSDIFADNLWATMLSGEDGHFSPPAFEKVLRTLVYIATFGTVSAHIVVVGTAAVVALQKAMNAGATAIVLGGLALLVFVLTTLAALFAVFIPMKYREKTPE